MFDLLRAASVGIARAGADRAGRRRKLGHSAGHLDVRIRPYTRPRSRAAALARESRAGGWRISVHALFSPVRRLQAAPPRRASPRPQGSYGRRRGPAGRPAIGVHARLALTREELRCEARFCGCSGATAGPFGRKLSLKNSHCASCYVVSLMAAASIGLKRGGLANRPWGVEGRRIK